MTRRVLEGRPPVSPQNEGCQSRESIPTRERNQGVPSALGVNQEDYGELPVPEDEPAVNEPVPSELLLTRLRPRGVLRRPERLIEKC